MIKRLLGNVLVLLLLLSGASFASTLRVKILDGANDNPLPGVKVMAVAFPEGQDEPHSVYTTIGKTGPDGIVQFSGLSVQDAGKPIWYKIAFIKEKVWPTIKDQISNPMIPKYRFDSDGQTIDITDSPIRLFPAPPDFQAGTLSIEIATTSVSGGTLMFADIRHRITDEQVAFGLEVATYSANVGIFSFDIVNIPPAPADTYRLIIGKMGGNEGAEILVSTSITDGKVSRQSITMGFISTTRSEEQTAIDVSDVAFEGFVMDKNNNAISDCSVEIRNIAPGMGYKFAKTLTDASGRFFFYRDAVEYDNGYFVQLSKLGFTSSYDNNASTSGYFYTGKNIVLPKYQLNIATGVIQGKVIINGAGLPDAEVGLETEWDRWEGPYNDPSMAGGGFFRTATRGDGTFAFNGVGSGSYNVRVNTPLLSRAGAQYWHPGDNNNNSQPDQTQPWNYSYIYNYGENQRSSYTVLTIEGFPNYGDPNNRRGGDDRRIVIDSDTIKTWVYSSSGTILLGANPSIDINITVPVSTNAVITGSLSFPDNIAVDKKQLRIVAHPIDSRTREWTEWQGKGVAYYASQDNITVSSGSALFQINVGTGTYFVEIRSEDWVPARMYNTEATLNTAGDAWQLPVMDMIRAGRLEGKIKLPNGNYFQAKGDSGGFTNAWIKLRGVDVQFDRWTELKEWSSDPTRFSFDALPPGRYNLWIEIKKFSQGGGEGTPLYPMTIIPSIRVMTEQTTFVEAQVKDGVLCEPIAPIPPEKPEVDYSARSANGTGMYAIVGFPSDISLNGSMLHALMDNEGQLDDLYVPLLNYDEVRKTWKTSYILPGKYNFYMVFVRMFGEDKPFDRERGKPENNPDEYMTIISRAENVNVKNDDLAPGATFQIKMGAGTMGSGILTGRTKGTKLLLPGDGEKIKGNFKEFSAYTPTIMLYDMDGVLRGYASVTPPNRMEQLVRWVAAVQAGDVNSILGMINSDDPSVTSPINYYLDSVPFGKYVLVSETKNYPPITKVITVSSGTTTLDLDFDADASQGARISGTVTDESGTPLGGANVVLSHRIVDKKAQTDAEGKFSVAGLPQGTYRIDVTKSGYAMGGDKVSLGTDDKSLAIQLKKAEAKITGKIYVRESGWSRKSVYTGAKLVAYNETENVNNPKKYLPSLVSKTENDGSFVIPDIILNNTYYLYAFVPQRPVYYKRIFISTVAMTNVDFDIMPSTPTLKVVMKRTENPFVFRFIIESPRPLVTAPECYYSPGSSFNSLKKIRALPTPGARNTYVLDVEIAENGDEETYTLQIKGQYGMREYMTEEINFSQKLLAKAKKEVSEELAEGGSILIDDERSDNTEVKLDPGTLTSDEMVDLPVGGFLTALPNFRMSKTGRDISTLIDAAMASVSASDVYEIGLNNAQVNKSFDVTLNYDRKKVNDQDIADLRVYQYNDGTGKWEQMPGITTVDPLTGTVSVEADALSSSRGGSPAPKAVIKNGVFAINKAASVSQTGAFAVFKQDPNTAKAYSGSTFEIYNFPNPFDLKSKSVVMQDVNSNASQTITGTLLKYMLPADRSGHLKLYVYNLSGELVKEIDEGSKTGGYYYYVEWDGKNDNGEECASGVYFLNAKLDGKKLNAKPLKMAILK